MQQTKVKPGTFRPERLFRALADPTRLRILRMLQEKGEVCVCHIVDALQVPQPTASRHLGYLRRAGLVEARKEGLWSHYSLTAPRDDLHRRLIDCVACCGDFLLGQGSCCAPASGNGRAEAKRVSRRKSGCC